MGEHERTWDWEQVTGDISSPPQLNNSSRKQSSPSMSTVHTSGNRHIDRSGKPVLPLAATVGIPSIEVACSASILLER